jgi:hypothetical protein
MQPRPSRVHSTIYLIVGERTSVTGSISTRSGVAVRKGRGSRIPGEAPDRGLVSAVTGNLTVDGQTNTPLSLLER